MRLVNVTGAAVVALLAVTPIGSTGARADTQAAATKAGWWIKVSTDKTKAPSIAFEIGRRERDHEAWRSWNAGDPPEFDVPESYVQAPRLYIRASASPSGSNGWLCLMYKDRGVKHFDFDTSEAQVKEQGDTDEECK